MMNFRYQTKLKVCVLGMLAVCWARATDAVLTGDTWVSAANPSNNYGTLPSLSVAGGSSALIQFNLSTLPAGTTAANIVKASLIVYSDNVTAPGTVDAAANSSWTESSVTFATLPAATPIPGATAMVGAAGQYLVFDVTSAVRNWVNTPALNFGFELLADTGTPGLAVAFYSKESTATSHPARLQVETAETGPAGPAGMQGQPGPIGPPGLPGPAGPAGVSALASRFGTNTNQAQASHGATCTLGEIILSGGVRANAMPASGQVLPIAQNQALFSLIGWMYSPSQSFVTFNLPDLRAAAPNGLTYSICVNGIFPTRN